MADDFGASFPLSTWELAMLRYALIFLVVALLAAAFGFSGIEGLALQISWVLFVVFLVLFVVTLITGRRVKL
jgi:uncharacterized membrane protein YtjA (UPF0391 family)